MSVEDEWEREIESDEDLDLLFITYQPQQVTIDELKQKIGEHGFTAELKQGN